MLQRKIIALRLLDIGFYGCSGFAMIAEQTQRRIRYRVHRFRPDQAIHIQHIAVAGVFGAGAGPQRALRAATFCFEFSKQRAVE